MARLPFVPRVREIPTVHANGSAPHDGPLARDGRCPAIGVSDVWWSYGSRQVLSGLDLEIRPGTLTALAGPNGAGKSTLFRLIAGVLRPPSGRIQVAGTDVASLSPRERSRLVAVVPQNPELPRGTAALEVVLMGRNPHLSFLSWEGPDDVAAAMSAMQRTESQEFLDRPVDQLSGGERQRVVIAMALAQDTPVLLLDEPTANLDLAYQPAIMRLLRDLAAAGQTVVTAVHDLTLAAQFCDSMALMWDGRVQAVGHPQQVLTPENIKQAYDADVTVMENPHTGRPVVLNS